MTQSFAPRQRPTRVLHVVRGMNRGGIESWLMHVLRHTDRAHVQMDFLVHDEEPGAHDAEIHALGGSIHHCARPKRPLTYGKTFKQILHTQGPYDVVHSHIHHYSGYILQLARQAGVPIRIAHSHLDTAALHTRSRPLRQSYIALMHHWIRQHATVGLAASQKAAVSLFGPEWRSDRRWQVLYCGIDLSPFQEPVDGPQLRQELHIPPDAFVMGHVGRFFEQKNHAFLVDILAEVVRREPCTRLLLVGDGHLRSDIEQKVARLGLQDHVIFAGLRKDISRLMLGAMDAFVLPSFYEGLPIVGIEAQAAGLPFILSDTITEELDCVHPLVQRVSLSQPASEWAEAVLSAHRTAPPLSRQEAMAMMQDSVFHIERGIAALGNVYAKKL